MSLAGPTYEIGLLCDDPLDCFVGALRIEGKIGRDEYEVLGCAPSEFRHCRSRRLSGKPIRKPDAKQTAAGFHLRTGEGRGERTYSD